MNESSSDPEIVYVSKLMRESLSHQTLYWGNKGYTSIGKTPSNGTTRANCNVNYLCSQSMGYPTICQHVVRLGYVVCDKIYQLQSYPSKSPDTSLRAPPKSLRRRKDSSNRKHKYTNLPLSPSGVAGSHTPARRMPRTKRFCDARKGNLADANYRSVYIQNHTREVRRIPLSYTRPPNTTIRS